MEKTKECSEGPHGMGNDVALDRAYRDGMRFGFALGRDGKEEEYQRIVANLSQDISIARQAADLPTPQSQTIPHRAATQVTK